MIYQIKQIAFILANILIFTGLGLLIKSNKVALSEQNKYIFQATLIQNKEVTGKLEPDLALLIKQRRKNPIRVAFHLKVDNIPTPYRGTNREVHREHLRNIKTRYAEIQKPLVDELKAKKQQVIYQSEFSPIVFALVTPKIIKEMTLRKDVERIYLEYGGYHSSSERTQQNQNVSRPVYVTKLFPSENSTQSSIDAISAQLNFAQEQIQVELNSFQLILNGADVTSQTRIGGSRNYPPGSLVMDYVVPSLKPGKHNAEIRFRIRNGKSQSYKWSFTLQ